MLVLEPLGLRDPAGATLNGLTVGVGGIRNLQGDVLRRVAMLGGEAADVAVGTNSAREHEPDLALLEHVGGPIPDTRLGAGVRDPLEAEGVLVPVGRLLGVADPQLEVVPPVQGHEVAL